MFPCNSTRICKFGKQNFFTLYLPDIRERVDDCEQLLTHPHTHTYKLHIQSIAVHHQVYTTHKNVRIFVNVYFTIERSKHFESKSLEYTFRSKINTITAKTHLHGMAGNHIIIAQTHKLSSHIGGARMMYT